jgi:butyryl-CoA dehydrogenase
MRLPFVVEMAANAFFYKASISVSGYAVLTTANANLLMVHGTPAQKDVFAARELSGQWFGTMCLSEPQAGSSLSDIATRAVPDGDDHPADVLGRPIASQATRCDPGGDREITRLHRIWCWPDPGGWRWCPAPAGSRCSRPRCTWTPRASCGERNDVAPGGLNLAGAPRHHQLLCSISTARRRHRIPGRSGPARAKHVPDERGAIRVGPAPRRWPGGRGGVEYARTQGRPRGAVARDASGAACPSSSTWMRAHPAGAALSEGALALELYCAGWSASGTRAARLPRGRPRCCWNC